MVFFILSLFFKVNSKSSDPLLQVLVQLLLHISDFFVNPIINNFILVFAVSSVLLWVILLWSTISAPFPLHPALPLPSYLITVNFLPPSRFHLPCLCIILPLFPPCIPLLRFWFPNSHILIHCYVQLFLLWLPCN